jgi:hypothetical protein
MIPPFTFRMNPHYFRMITTSSLMATPSCSKEPPCCHKIIPFCFQPWSRISLKLDLLHQRHTYRTLSTFPICYRRCWLPHHSNRRPHIYTSRGTSCNRSRIRKALKHLYHDLWFFGHGLWGPRSCNTCNRHWSQSLDLYLYHAQV